MSKAMPGHKEVTRRALLLLAEITHDFSALGKRDTRLTKLSSPAIRSATNQKGDRVAV